MSLFNKKNRQRVNLGLRYIENYFISDFIKPLSGNYSIVKPLDVLCEITYNCNLKCPTCFRWTSKPDENELKFEDWKTAILDLKRWLRVFNLSFSGGEPFLKKDFLEICKFASENGAVVSAVSNGSLIDEGLAKRIVSSGLDALSLSLNSLNPEVHNKTRGTISSFTEVMSAIENLKERGEMRLTISTTVMKENINDLIGLVEFVRSQGLDGINFQPLMEASILPAYNKDGESQGFSEGKLFHEIGKGMKENDVFDHLIDMKDKGFPINNSPRQLRYIAKYLQSIADPEILSIPCKIDSKNFFIDPFGNVRICEVMEPVGNISKDKPQKIWKSEKAKRQREKIRKCQKTCRLMNCNFKELDLGYRIKQILRQCLH